MLQTIVSIRRSSGLWGELSPESVEQYRKELENRKKELSDFSFLYRQILFGGEELTKAVQSQIEEEIKYCLFYEEFRQRQNEPTFGEWIFTKQDDIKLQYEWQKIPGEQWTKRNGRVKATIQFDRTGMMVKLSLSYANDSDNLKFYEKPYSHKPEEAHLKSEASIEARVQQFKEQADAFLNDHLYPVYSQSEVNLLYQLLHIR